MVPRRPGGPPERLHRGHVAPRALELGQRPRRLDVSTAACGTSPTTGGVDVVLSGNEHDYERFAPQNAAGNLDTTYGVRRSSSAPVATTSTRSERVKPNSEAFSSTFGVLKLTLHPTSYDWQFIPVAGETFTDSGTGSCHGSPP